MLYFAKCIVPCCKRDYFPRRWVDSWSTVDCLLDVIGMQHRCCVKGTSLPFHSVIVFISFWSWLQSPKRKIFKRGKISALLFVISKGWVLVGLTSLLEGGIPQPDGSSTWGRLQRGLRVSPAPCYSIFSPSLGDTSPFLINVTPKHISPRSQLYIPDPQRGHIYSIMLTASSPAPRVSLHCLNRSNIIWSPTFQLSSRG